MRPENLERNENAAPSRNAENDAFRQEYLNSRTYGEVYRQPQSMNEPLSLMTITNGGGEVTLNGCGKVTEIRDAAGREFDFGYDPASGTLNFVKNESGTFYRESTDDGSYTNTWRGEGGGTWQGTVSVDTNGYRFEGQNTRIGYKLDGTKVIETLGHDREAIHRESIAANGDTTFQDLRDNFLPRPGKDVRDINQAPSRTFDSAGHLIEMKDGAGHDFKFSKFDQNGQPTEISNLSGTWRKIGDRGWQNQASGAMWYGKVELDAKDGRYSYTDLSGQRHAYFIQGLSAQDYAGVAKLTLPDGRSFTHFEDDFGDATKPFRLNPTFEVKDGHTDAVHLNRKDVSVAYGYGDRDDVHAEINLPNKGAVGAFQDGIVVYSSRKPGSEDQRAHVDTGTVIGLSAGDRQAIEEYAHLNAHDQNVVVVQTYDKKTGGVRYELYSGLAETNVVDGDRIRAGQVIGRVGEDGKLNFGVRKNAISARGGDTGQAIDIVP